METPFSLSLRYRTPVRHSAGGHYGRDWYWLHCGFLQYLKLRLRKPEPTTHQVESFPDPVVHLVLGDLAAIVFGDVGSGYSGRKKFVPWVKTLETGLDPFLLGRQVFLDRDKDSRLCLVPHGIQFGPKVIIG